jgi:hypothetical protein
VLWARAAKGADSVVAMMEKFSGREWRRSEWDIQTCSEGKTGLARAFATRRSALGSATHRRLGLDSLEELVHMGGSTLRLLENLDDGLAVLAVVGSLDGSAVNLSNLLLERKRVSGGLDTLCEGTRTHLESVANTENGNAVGEHIRVDVRSVGVVDGVGGSREDNPWSATALSALEVCERSCR